MQQKVRNEANPINRLRWEAEPTGHQGQQSVVSERGCCRDRDGSTREGRHRNCSLGQLLQLQAVHAYYMRQQWQKFTKYFNTSCFGGGVESFITLLLTDSNIAFSFHIITHHSVADMVRFRQKCQLWEVAWVTVKRSDCLDSHASSIPH